MNKIWVLALVLGLCLGTAARVWADEAKSPLIQAIENGDTKTIQKLIDGGADVNEQDKNLTTPLMIAAGSGNLKIIQQLLDNGADVNAFNQDKETALIMAIANGNLDAVKLLFGNGAEVSIEGDGGSHALWKAVDHPNIIPLLLEHGVTPNLQAIVGDIIDNIQRRYYTEAERNDAINAVLTLINNGANVNAMTLARVVCSGNAKLVKALIDKGADVDNVVMLSSAACQDNLEVLQILLDHGGDINARWHGRTPLLCALDINSMKVAKFLINKGADVNVKDNNTPLIYAVKKGNIEITKLLLDKGADVNAFNQDKETALTEAIANGNLDAVKLLFDHGAEVSIEGDGGSHALWKAVDHPNIIPFLLEHGVTNPDGVDEPWTPEHDGSNTVLGELFFNLCMDCLPYTETEAEREAQRNDAINAVLALINKGANVNAIYERGYKVEYNYTPLLLAILYGNIKIIKALIDKGADVNFRPESFWAPPLIIAVSNIEITRLLLDKGADVNIRDSSGRSALMHATALKDKTIVNLLKSYMKKR